jgi:pimeloyl-ACP methyl ester carboxylesterase
MKKGRFLDLAILILVSLIISACGSGGDHTGEGNPSTTVNGQLQASYINGVKVCVNDSSLGTANENCDTTKNQGNFVLENAVGKDLVVLIDTIPIGIISADQVTTTTIITPAAMSGGDPVKAQRLTAFFHQAGSTTDNQTYDMSAIKATDIDPAALAGYLNGTIDTVMIGSITVNSAHNPIVFVHGLAGGASDWNTMKQNFIDAGWPSNQLFAISLSNPDSGDVGINIIHAGEIRDYINNTVLPQTGASRVDIIAFSMGGLASMYYVHALNGATDGKVADVVCLDADVQGSTTWSWLIPDLDQSTPVVTAVRTYDQTPGGVLPDPAGTPHVAGNMTYTFYWQTNSICALDGGVSQQWVDVSHLDFLTNADVFNGIKTAVQQNEN